MNQRRHMTVISGVVALLASAPLSILFQQWTWIIDAVIVVAAVTGALVGVRALRAPVWSQPIAGVLALLLIITWLNPSHHEYGGLLPSPGTFHHFGDLLGQAGSDIRSLAAPVLDTPGLLLIAMLGVGAVTLVIDFVTVVLRKPALAGLPMLAIYAVPVAIDDHSVNFLPFAISALGYAWLLVTDNIDRVRLFGRRFTGDGRGVDMWEPSPLGSVGRRIAVIGTLLAIIVPAAAPGMTRGFFGGVGTGGGGDRVCDTCPAGSNVDLLANLAGQLRDSKVTPMLQVSTTDARPPYVRLAVASTLTNKGFLTAPSTGTSYTSGLTSKHYDPQTGEHAPGVTYETYTATIKVNNLTVGYLPSYDVPTQLQGVSPKWRWDDVNDVLFSTSENTTSGMTYTITYARPVISVDALRAAPPVPADSPARNFLAVPSSPKEVNDVLNRPDTQASGEYERVMKLYDYLSYRHGFSYSLETKGGSTGTDIGNFLTNKTGYCVQYAAALAWLVRAAGYPARVAEGFTSGQPAGKPGDYVMTNQNLHAWTEVYFEGLGWIPFDATPPVAGSVGQEYAPLNRVTVDPSGGVEPSLTRPAGPVPSGVGQSGPRKPIIDPSSVGSARPATSSIGFWLTIVAILAGIGALAPVVARTIARNRRSTVDGRVTSESAAPGEPYIVIDGGDSAARARARVHSAWDEYVDTLVDYQVPIDPTETPRTATARVVTELYLPTDVAGGVRTLGAAEEKARYARHPGHSEPFTPILRSLRRALASRVSWRTRLRATLLPPSVTQRWRTAAAASWISLATRSQRQRDGLGRAVNVRRWFARPSRAQ
jgi:transglutaminase-like putative cysteine protease